MSKQDLTGCVLYSDAARGIYIPQHFARTVNMLSLYGYTVEDFNAIYEGPDHPDYWSAWDDILRCVYLFDSDTKQTYRLHHDDDLWLMPVDHEFFAQVA